MALASLIRKGVAVADKVTKDIQVSVTLHRWLGDDDYGKATAPYDTTHEALLDFGSESIRLPEGEESFSVAKVTIIGPVAVIPEWRMTKQAEEQRTQPIDPRDTVTLPDGNTWPILTIKGLTDSGTNAPYLYELRLGNNR